MAEGVHWEQPWNSSLVVPASNLGAVVWYLEMLNLQKKALWEKQEVVRRGEEG